MRNRLNAILDKIKGKQILVVGDLILDEYVWGNVSRISPEAPVPIIEVSKQTFLPGGCAYVATQIKNLGGNVCIAGVIGNDRWGEQLTEKLKKNNVNVNGIIIEANRPTTVKTRVIAKNQQVVRIDNEVKTSINRVTANAILKFIVDNIKNVQAVVMSDYDKGVLTPHLLAEVIKLCRSKNKPIVVDPKPKYCLHYKGVTVITPNAKEAAESVGLPIRDEETLKKVGKELLSHLNCDAVLITRGEYGMTLFEKNATDKITHIPTIAQEVYDVTGAGDTVVSVLSLALAAKASMKDAANLANFAAGIVVGKLGAASVSINEIKNVIKVKIT
ncbi:MAG: D-glycero-beta-D-manno-heptose-7-phosphate kinase [Candidatus Firestonebacteria bacterium]